LLLAIPFKANGQANNAQEIARNSYFLEKKSVTQPSPGAANLGKYGEVNINNFTGALNLQFPIHTVKGSDIGTSVSVSYDGSGNKVEALPSLVGLGFTLNAGGVITRSIQGKPDLNSNYYSRASELYNYPSLSDAVGQNDFYYKIAKGTLEAQPDVYYFNFGGFSGKFVFKADKTVIMKDAKDILITPAWSSDDDVANFTIVDALGTKYYFTETERTRTTYLYDNNFVTDITPTLANYDFTSAWYLTKIEAANGNETIEFSYTTLNPPLSAAYQRPQNLDNAKSKSYSKEVFPNSAAPATESFSNNINSTTTISNRRFINYITYKLGTAVIEKLEFVKSVPNLTFSGQAVETDGQKLDTIKIYGGVNAATALRQFNFIQDGSTNRLTLKKIEEASITETSIPKKIHEFTYESTALPAVSSNSVDHWGYYNGAGNSGPIPSYAGYAGDGANRNSTQAALSSILTQVKYPTMGYSVFMHETHLEAGVVGQPERTIGGARIKEIKNYLENGVVASSKQYKYCLENSTTSSGLLLGSEPLYADLGTSKSFASEYQCPTCSGAPLGSGSFVTSKESQRITLYAVSRASLGSVQGSQVGYSRIEEITDGKVVYHFRAVKLSPTEWDDNDNGNLLKKEIFHANGKKLSEMTNVYTTDARRSAELISYSVDADPIQDNLNLLCKVQYMVNGVASGAPYYMWRSGSSTTNKISIITTNRYDTKFRIGAGVVYRQSWKLMPSSTEKQYFYDTGWNLTNTVVTTTDNVYGNASVSYPTETTVQNSDNLVYKTKTYYTGDMTTGSQTAIGVINNMITKRMIAFPLKTENYAGTKLVGAVEVVYETFNTNQIWQKFLRVKDRVSSTWYTKYTIDNYETSGSPKQTTMGGFTKSEVFTWDRHLLLNKTFGNVAPNILTWGYTYNSKDEVDVMTDENGLRTKFYFDGLQRLSKSQNRFTGTDINNPQDVQATTIYDYHYKNSPTDYNYVGTISTFKGVTDPLSTKQYLDGLGRPIEVVKELYTPPTANHSAYWHQKNYVTYDLLGRHSRSYLPFETGTLGFENASIYLNAAGYVETAYEASPLSRPISQRNADDTKTYMSYGANTATDAVQIMVPVTTPLPVGVLVSASSPNVYGINTLYKTTMTDENGKQTCVFKDKLGRVILTRKFLNGASGANVDTYNVYDDYGQLVVVVPPGALTISNTTATVVNDLTFQYKYDNKNRLIEKKIPGADVQKFYYDARDLLVMTQDGNMRFAKTQATPPVLEPKFLATLYDDLGRVTKTGFTVVAPVVNTAGDCTTNIATTITDRLTETIYYDNKTWVKHQGAKVLNPTSLILNTNFLWSYTERRVGLEYTGNPVWQGKQHLRYRLVSQNPILDSDIYGVDWVVSGYNGMQQPDLTIRYLFEDPNQAGEVRTWQNFTYDNGRRLTDIKYNYGTGGAGISSPTYAPSLSNMNYNFKDQLIEKNIGFTGTSALQSIDYTYNIRGWLTNINNVALNNGSTMSIMTPNMTGSGTIQNLAITPFINRALAEAVKPYRAANANELPPIGDNNSDLFSQNITYENPATQTGATSQYNGNISSTTWQVLGREKQAYGFKYDGLDRLTEAKYFDIAEQYYAPYTSIYNSTDKKYDETITYDLRGNITSLKRNGLNDGSWTQAGVPIVAATYGIIDNLVYNYNPNVTTATGLRAVVANTSSNKLLNVSDISLNNKGFKYNGTAVPTYTYDENGNLTSDGNKFITAITYNYLNLPTCIKFAKPTDALFGGKIEFVYDATGVKLKKLVTYNDVSKPTEEYDYINGVEYKGGVLQRFVHTEGSVVRQTNATFMQEYDLRDHLGNTRVTFTDANNDGVVLNTDIKQINHYYPFGLNMEGNWQGGAQGDNKYQYNGKQWNDDFGLGWNDYGARFYDPAMARWTAVDPLADKMQRHSPYTYCFNTPLVFIDANGKIPTPREAALIAQHSYGGYSNNILEGGWIASTRTFGLELNQSNGLKSMIYERMIDNKVEFVYATVGTVDKKDWEENANQISGTSMEFAASIANAKELDKSLKDEELTFVGHSQGGGEAAANAYATGRKAITFNAAGVSLETLKNNKIAAKKNSKSGMNNIAAFIMTSDPLNSKQNSIRTITGKTDFIGIGLPDVDGTRTYIQPTSYVSKGNGHSIDNVVNELKKLFPNVPITIKQ
jgi:RHS repeat-associated protein